MTKSALQTVQDFQQWMANGNESWEDLFSENVVFKGPVDTVQGKAANIELNKGFMPLVKSYEPKAMLEQGDLAVLEGVYTVGAPTGKTIQLETMEIYEVKEGLIENIRIYYDAEEFRKEFASKV